MAPAFDDDTFLEEVSRMLETTELALALPSAADNALLAEDVPLVLLDTDESLVPEPITTTGDSATEPSRPMHPSTAGRMRQREELEYLQKQVLELEVQLVTLQVVKNEVSPPEALTSSDKCMESSRLWERIAKRQMTAKQKAEIENAKLREMLQGQLKIAQSLARVLRKRASSELAVEALEPKRHKHVDAADPAVYEQLKLGLDARYREVSTAYQQNGLATNRSDFDDIRVISNRDDVSVEIMYARVLPFDFARTSAAVWTCSSMSYLPLTDGYYSAQAVATDELASKFEIPLAVRRQTMTIHSYAAMKRYRESGSREVYAWEGWSIIRSSHKHYDGIEFVDHGWTVVETLETNDPENPATIVQCCSRLMPDKQSVPKQSPIGVLSDVLLASYNRNFATLAETVETMLLRTHLGE